MVIYTILKPANLVISHLNPCSNKDYTLRIEKHTHTEHHSLSKINVAETTVVLNDSFPEYKPSSMAKLVNAILINILEIKMVYDTYPTVIYTDTAAKDSKFNSPYYIYKINYNKPINKSKNKFDDMRDVIVNYINDCVGLMDDDVLSDLQDAYLIYKEKYVDDLSVSYTKLLAKFGSLTYGKIDHPFIYTLEQYEYMFEDRHFDFDDNRSWKHSKFISKEQMAAVYEPMNLNLK